MHDGPLAPADLLTAWEQVRSLPAAGRPPELLRVLGQPDQPTVGTREAALLQAYLDNFGARLDGLARCPSCGTDVELSVPVAELAAGLPAAQPIEPLLLDGEPVSWRLPNDADLEAAAAAGQLPREPGYRAVQTISGVGPVLGAVFVAEIGDATRFARPEKLCSCAGLPATASPTPRSAEHPASRGLVPGG